MAFEESSQETSIGLDKKIAFSIILGVFITLVTALIPNNTVIGASNFGYPFPWVSYPLYPIGSPPTIMFTAFGVDIIIMTIIAFVVINTYQFLKSR